MTGLVLAGGDSRRFGRNKVFQRFGGETFLTRSVALLRQVCDSVVVSGVPPQGEGDGFTWIPDHCFGPDDKGPMRGVLTCLEELGTPVFALACDLLRMDATTLARLARHREGRGDRAVLTTWVHPATGYIEPLCAIYEPEAAPLLRGALEAGERRIFKAIPMELTHGLPVGPGEEDRFFNCNTPDDLARFQG